jgi:hypothetical protein
LVWYLNHSFRGSFHDNLIKQEIVMSTRPIRSVAKMLHYCKICLRETTHEINEARGVETAACVPCLERSVSYELDRE